MFRLPMSTYFFKKIQQIQLLTKKEISSYEEISKYRVFLSSAKTRICRRWSKVHREAITFGTRQWKPALAGHVI